MVITTYLARVSINAGLTLLCALPFLIAALWHYRKRPYGLVLSIGFLVLFQNAVTELPPVNGFQHLHWSWQAAALTAALPLLVVMLTPAVSLASIGLTARLTPGWLKPAIVALIIAMAVPLVFFGLGSRVRLTSEGWAYLLVMPGLAEEILFRGLYQSLLNSALGRCWRFGGAHFGWGLVITSVLFAAANGLIAVDTRLHARIVLPAAIAPFMLGAVSGWVRERTNSIWPSILGHNLSNIVIPVATLVSQFF